jgi:predicted ATPase
MVFVTGDAGLGKTALVNAFLEQTAANFEITTARGECHEHKAQAEPFMPVLDALADIGRGPAGSQLRDTLAKYAPTWLAQLPWLCSSEDAQLLQKTIGDSRARMLRQIRDALVAFASHRTLVLVLEDVHWCDLSTVDFLALLGRQTTAARLLIIATYRAADAKASAHPLHLLVRELKLRQSSQELQLGLLPRDAIHRWIEERYDTGLAAVLTPPLHRLTDGNPLFIETALQSWFSQGDIRNENGHWRADMEEFGVPPETLSDFLAQQVKSLPELRQSILEGAAVATPFFCARILAELIQRPLEDVDPVCAAMADSNRFFHASGLLQLPDGTACDQFRFKHEVFADAISRRLSPGRRLQLHLRMAHILQNIYGSRQDEIASELAGHFREAHDHHNAIKYMVVVAQQAIRKNGHHDALRHLDEALRLLPMLPPEERQQHELTIQASRGPALMVSHGFADEAAEKAFRRTIDLAEALNSDLLFPAAFGLAAMLELRGEFATVEQLMQSHLPKQESACEYVVETRQLLACSTFHQGQFASALHHARSGLEHVVDGKHSALLISFGENPAVECYMWAALAEWFLGRADHALADAKRAMSIAERPDTSYALANAQAQLTVIYQLRNEVEPTLHWAEKTLSLGEQQEIPYRVALGRVLRGWAQSHLGAAEQGLADIEAGLRGSAATGAILDRPYFLALYAQALAAADRTTEAMNAISEGVDQIARTRSYFYEAELWRLRGLFLHKSARDQESVESLWRAVEIAHEQHASSLELRALASICKFAKVEEKQRAMQTLSILLGAFTEGFDTPDLVFARTLVNAVHPGASG